MKKYSIDDVKSIIKNNLGDEYILLESGYKNVDTPIKIVHSCGNIFFPTVNNILSYKTKCPFCSGNNKKTTDMYKSEVLKLVGNEYSVLEEYVNTNTPIKMKHNKCGHEYSVSPHNFIGTPNRDGRRCPKCSKHLKFGIDDIAKFIKDKYGDEYILLSKTYKNNHTYLDFKHSICGTIFKSTFMNMKKEFCHCPICNATSLTTLKSFLEDVEKLGNGEYKCISEEYKGVDYKVKMIHKKCGTEYIVRPSRFLQGDRCPRCGCSRSKGEEIISNVLKENKIEFLTQKKFEDCTDSRLLTFDFFIPKYNILIEFDGEQHFRPYRSRSNNVEKFKTTVRHDEIKTNFCKSNNYHLLRIPYTEIYNTKELINKLIKLLNENPESDPDNIIKSFNIHYPDREVLDE